jgi:hypothetical protein
MERLSGVVGSRYGALLLMLLVHLVLYSFVGRHSAIRWLLDLSVLALVGSSIHAISGRRWTRRFILVIGLITMILATTGREMALDSLHPFGLMGKGVMVTAVMIVIFNDVLKRSEVDMDAVLGVCCVYLLLGLGWDVIYGLIEWQIPNSFSLPAGRPSADGGPGPHVIQSELLYFSLITMTTVGYGDITPKSPPAKIFAALQAMMTQLYVAIVIARMVGMELANRQNRSSNRR